MTGLKELLFSYHLLQALRYKITWRNKKKRAKARLMLIYFGGPNGIRTRVLALRGLRPRPLVDGAFKEIFGWGTGTRTPITWSRVRRAAIAPFPNVADSFFILSQLTLPRYIDNIILQELELPRIKSKRRGTLRLRIKISIICTLLPRFQ